jgi:subtilisin-like proprotein convertase family protein
VGAVVGGEEAPAGAWPWQVVLVQDGDPFCGAALIAADVALTAAHCVDDVDDAAVVELRAGSVDVDDDAMQRRVISGITMHEAYNDATTENDIAILRVEVPFELGPTVAPATLPDEDTEDAITEEGDPAVVTGFGATESEGRPSRTMRQAEVAVYGDAHCTGNYDEDGDAIFGATQVCAGVDAGGVDSCYGDSGGPLVAPGPHRATWYLIGLVSWGAGCGIPERPTVHTQVTDFRDWLAGHGVATALASRFESDRRLRLPSIGSRGKASRWPATIEVDEFDGPVESVSVELHGITHERLADLDIWLEAPDGTVVALVSDSGGDHVTDGLTLLVTALGSPVGAVVPGLARVAPTDNEADPERRGPDAATDLGVLAGIDGEGEWRLLVADDGRGATGVLTGWAIVLQPAAGRE